MKHWLPWLLAIACIALFVGLGRWQLERAAEKQHAVDSLARSLAEPRPQAIAARAASGPNRIDRVFAQGRFIDAPILLLDNQIREGAVGLRAYRVFQPDALDQPVLVELGWLPVPPDRRLPATVALETYYRLDGLLLPPPSAGLRFGPPGQRLADGRWLLTRLDPAELSSVLGLEKPLLERVLRPDPADRIGYTRSLDVLSNTLPPEKHRGYAVQWFALAAAVAFVAVFLTFRRKAA
ncbi:MAG: SURF1 family protein [Xanthomonadaceae bacterium]|nr:SURF1 family protein [Xanthomonadaceae bacterium]